MVKKPNPKYIEGNGEEEFFIRLYRGTNMEVSMPTGSLCAERNVIGSALAADLTLKRQDLKFIAVYSACLDPIDASEGTGTGTPSEAMHGKSRSSSILSASPDKESISAVLFENDIGEMNINANINTIDHGGVVGDGNMKVDVVGSPGRNGPNSSRRLSRSVTTTQYTNNTNNTNAKPTSPSKTGSVPPPDLPKFDDLPRVLPGPGPGSGPGPLEIVKSPMSRIMSVPNMNANTRTSTNTSAGTPKLETPTIKKTISRVFTMPRAPSTSSNLNTEASMTRTSTSLSPTMYTNTISSPSPPTFDDNMKTTDESGLGSGNNSRIGTNSTNTHSNPHSPSRDSIRSSLSDSNLYETEKRYGDISSPNRNKDLFCRPISNTNCIHACNDVKTTTRSFSVRESDMNPLKPCGACNEWLKKIAEVNPDFSVITFTDENCHGVYVEEIDCV